MNFDYDFSTEPQVNNNSNVEMNLDDVLSHLDAERISDDGYEHVLTKINDMAVESEDLEVPQNMGNTDAGADHEIDAPSHDFNVEVSDCISSEDYIESDSKVPHEAQVENFNDETIPMRTNGPDGCYSDEGDETEPVTEDAHPDEVMDLNAEHKEVENDFEQEPLSYEQESVPLDHDEDIQAEDEIEEESYLHEQQSVPLDRVEDNETEYEHEQESLQREQESIPLEHVEDEKAGYEIKQESHSTEQESVPLKHVEDNDAEYETGQEPHSHQQESLPLGHVIEEELKENGLSHVESSLEEDVYPGEEITAMDQVSHKQCFRCTQCSCILTAETNHVYEGKPYCESHYDELLTLSNAPINDVVKHSYTRADYEELPAPQFTKTMMSKYKEACDASPAPTTTSQQVGKLKTVYKPESAIEVSPSISNNEILPPTGSAKRLVNQWSSINQTSAETLAKQSAAINETHYAPNTAKSLAAKFSAGLFEPSESDGKSSKSLANGDQVENDVGSQGDELPSQGQARGLIAKFSAMHA